MTNTIRRELKFAQSPEAVWRSLTDSAALAEWMYPNDFEPRVGHHFTFRVPPGFEQETALKGAEYGWDMMHGKLAKALLSQRSFQ